VFVDNSAGSLGGAILFETCDQIQVSDVFFKSNEAPLGGAVYILAEDSKETNFHECVLEGNTAEDGGAVYLNTGPGVDIFNDSVFRDNFASESPGGSSFVIKNLASIRFICRARCLLRPDRISVYRYSSLPMFQLH